MNICIDVATQMIGDILAINALLLLAYMTSFFLVAKLRKRLDTVDIAWGLGFVLIAWSTFALHARMRNLVIAVLVSMWGLRLANHIYQRSKFKKSDPRYEELSSKWKGNFWLRAYVSVFLLQGLLIALVGLPIVMATGRKLPGLEWLTYVGAVVWFIGFIIEMIADKQLGHYIRLEKRPKVLNTGLWRYSRHPNYFGELTQWWAIGIIALQASWGWIGLVGPAVLTILIVFVSGIPPIERRRAKDSAYRQYQKETSALIPLPSKKA